MDIYIDLQKLSIIFPALIAGLLILSTHIPLGQVILKRGIIFIDLAVAQIAALGVVLAHVFIPSPVWWFTQLVALCSALGGALLLSWTEDKWMDIQEALIGIVFVLAATISVLLLSSSPVGSEHLQEILTGQILWVSSEQLIYTGVIYALILFFWYRSSTLKQGVGFYLVFATCVTLSVQLIGVYLVFSSLIIPAVAVSKIKNRNKILIAYACGGLGYISGLLISLITDLPTGPVIVIMLAISGLLFWNLFSEKPI